MTSENVLSYYRSAAYLRDRLNELEAEGRDLAQLRVILDGCDCTGDWGGVINETDTWEGPCVELVRADHDIIEAP